MLTCGDINIRDPFVLPVASEQCYYMYGTTGQTTWTGRPEGFNAYRSKDLAHWEGPIPAFRPPAGFWSDRHHWAPEVHYYRGRYYCFITFHSSAGDRCRGTQILVADLPCGPFVPHTPFPVTPADWFCLDGTLFVDYQGKPWMVFCHEWVQIGEGTVCLMPLLEDLSGPAGKPQVLFSASAASWCDPFEAHGRQNNYVTDGPFLHRTAGGSLLMLWSSSSRQGYVMGLARSTTGLIQGPWEQQPKPLFSRDGGHGMLFKTFDGRLMMTVHQPNDTPNERPVFIEVRELGDTIEPCSI